MKKGSWFVYLIIAVSAVLFISGVYKKIIHQKMGILPAIDINDVNNISIVPKQNPLTPRGEKVISVIPKGTASMWWEVVHQGANDAGKKFGYSISWIGPELETDREKQIQVVEDAINTKSKAIVLGPNDKMALVRPVLKIKEAGIPCVIMDSAVDANSDDYVSFVATDNYLAGRDAARTLAAAINNKGNVLLTKFVQNSASTDARAEGFKQTLEKEFPDIKIIDEQFAIAGTVEDARQKTLDMLTRNKNVVGLFAVNQPSSVGAYKALQAQGVAGQIKMVGFDSDPILLDGIAAGEVEALIAQNPYEIGYQGVKTAVDAIDGKKVSKTIPIPSMIINKKNLEEMKQKYPAALGL
jgi:ribose transport system substrate-binding protein